VSEENEKEGLKMIWPADLRISPPAVLLPEGYTLRTFQPGDETPFYELMGLAGFGHWDDEIMQPWRDMVLPDGWFLIVDETGGQMVSTAIAHHRPDALHPFGGSLGWLAGHPEHAGKGLGMAISAAVVRRLLEFGYKNIYLNTEDWRLPALSIYLRLGWVPLLYLPDMEERWRDVCAKLGWPFTPQMWPAGHAEFS